MKYWKAAILIAGVVFSVTAFCQGRSGTLITINPPGVSTAPGQGSQAPAINQAGMIAGFFTDSSFVTHSFFRTAQGDITVFDAPGAGSQTVGAGFASTPAGVLWGQGTYAWSINPQGAISGGYFDSNDVQHGFVRWPDGTFTTIDIQDAGTNTGQGTVAANINEKNEVAGVYWDDQGASHGFFRSADGSVTTFDAPGAGTAAGEGTNPCCATSLSPRGDVSGWYVDTENTMHGFIRDANGNITPFEVPGAGTLAGQGTAAWSITPSGAVTGEVVDSNSVLHAYVRDGNGKVTVFDAPGAVFGTIGEGLNATGAVEGNYFDASGVSHGYVRDANGKFTFIDAPGASTTPGQGTVPLSNNPSGKIAGAYYDATGVLHAFLWIP